MLFGVFSAVFLVVAVGLRTLITFSGLLRWFLLFAVAGNFVPLRWYAKALVMDRADWFWFNLVAVGPILLGAALSINFLLHGPERKLLIQEDPEFDLHLYWRTHGGLPPHLPWPTDAAPGPDGVVYGLAPGSLGYWVITSRAVVPGPGAGAAHWNSRRCSTSNGNLLRRALALPTTVPCAFNNMLPRKAEPSSIGHTDAFPWKVARSGNW